MEVQYHKPDRVDEGLMEWLMSPTSLYSVIFCLYSCSWRHFSKFPHYVLWSIEEQYHKRDWVDQGLMELLMSPTTLYSVNFCLYSFNDNKPLVAVVVVMFNMQGGKSDQINFLSSKCPLCWIFIFKYIFIFFRYCQYAFDSALGGKWHFYSNSKKNMSSFNSRKRSMRKHHHT